MQYKGGIHTPPLLYFFDIMKENIHWVIDYETLSNCTVLVAEHYQKDIRKEFVIHRLRNDVLELVAFLLECKQLNCYHISFNGLVFDSQVTEFFLRNEEILAGGDPEYIANEVYQIAQEIIERQDSNEFPEFGEKDLQIRPIDVFKINHWDNPAKRSSLKWIQYTMDWPNIQEMPIHHNKFIDTMDEINTILSYCRNDVSSTKNILKLSSEQVMLRKRLTDEYGINLTNASEPRISKELFLHFLSKKTGESKYELKQLRTHREKIVVKDILLPYLEKIKQSDLHEVYEWFRDIVIDDPENLRGKKMGIKTRHGGIIDFGLGGIHGIHRSGVYTSDEKSVIMTSDVTSFYPRMAILNRWAPAHLNPDDFCEQYEWFFVERLKIPKKDIKNYVYKIILNSTYGLSNDKNCFLYDPEFTMRITINGQLSLLLLYIMIMDSIPEAEPIMQNTDGLETKIPVDKIDKYMEICEEWQNITKLNLEHDQYEKLFLADVNNYIAVYKNGKTKCKGRFEFEDLALHKNKSFLIVPKAVYNYFVKGIVPEQTIMENNNIYDYCAGNRTRQDWQFQMIPGNLQEERKVLQKVVRYYVSNKGNPIMKVNTTDGREQKIEAGKRLTEFNVYVKKPWAQYDINTGYYLTKIYDEIYNIESNKNQLSLF